MKIQHQPESKSSKAYLWQHIYDIYSPDYIVNDNVKKGNLVFVQSALYQNCYAYSAYLSILSLYAATDISQYDIRIYCTKNLEGLLKSLFSNFKKVSIITQTPLLSLHPEWININKYATDLVIKTQYWLDDYLLNYDVICGLDADLFAVGQNGSFVNLETIAEGIYLSFFETDAYDNLERMLNTLNKNPSKQHIKRINEEYGINCKQDILKQKPNAWGNSSLYAIPTKYIKEDKYEFLQMINFWFSEPCLCDESFFRVFSFRHGTQLKDINIILKNAKHFNSGDHIFRDKHQPMHLIDYGCESAITHRVSSTTSCLALSKRFKEYINYVSNNFHKKYKPSITFC